MDEHNREELHRLADKTKRHKMFVDTDEYLAIDGIPNRIDDKVFHDASESEIRREIKKLHDVAIDNDDHELLNLADKMKRRL